MLFSAPPAATFALFLCSSLLLRVHSQVDFNGDLLK